MATKLTRPISPFKKGMETKLSLGDHCKNCGLPMSKRGICPECGYNNP